MFIVYLCALLLILNCVFFGIGNALTSDVVSQIPLFTFLALRFSVAAFLFLVISPKRIYKNLFTLKKGKGPLLLVCVLTALSYLLANVSLSLTQASISGFFLSVAVLFAPFLTAWFHKTKLDWRILPVLGMTLFGLYLLCGGFGDTFSFGWGEATGLMCSAVFASQIVCSSKYLMRYGWEPVTLSAVQTGFMAFVCLPIALIADPPFQIASFSVPFWLAIGFIAVFCTLINYIFQNFALLRVCPVYASVAMSTEMIFTLMAAHFISGETLSVSALIGGALVFIAVIIASFFTNISPPEST